MIAPDRRTWLTLSTLALACVASVWPILASQSIPAFQQDWAWPLSRAQAWEWFHTFVGLWDGRGTAHANLLPWQTYVVAVQTLFVAVFGAATGLALWIVTLELLAAAACIAMLDAFGVASWPARVTAALFYAGGPVVFTRIAAGHLAYLLGYALLPLAIALGLRAIERRSAVIAVWLGIVIGLAGSQIQFLVIAWIAIAPLPFVSARAPGWGRRLLAAAAIAIAVQLQALLPQLFGSAAAAYAAQPALVNFEYNNSAPLQSAPVMLGYFTHYYESHAPPGASIVLFALLAIAVALAIYAGVRYAVPALALVAIGSLLSAGLYGPLSVALTAAFEHIAFVAVFRDLHYFAALTAVGIALGLGTGLQRLPPAFSAAVLVIVAWIALPLVGGAALRDLIVPKAFVTDALADMRAAVAAGPGRVLWLPAEEPLGPNGGSNSGRDFTAYGPPANPSLSDDYQNPQLAYALATLRSGRPDWNAFAELNVRYLVVRAYVRSMRATNFGNGLPMAFEGLDDAQVARLAARSPALRVLRRSALSIVYEFSGNAGFTYAAPSNAAAMLYSELAPHEVAVEPVRGRLTFPTSPTSADPRQGWLDGTLGWRYTPWLPDSIYPFVWTLSRDALPVNDAHDCVLAAAVPHGARLSVAGAVLAVQGTWKRYAIGRIFPNGSFLPGAGDVSAIAQRPCPIAPLPRLATFNVADGYDAGWRALDQGRWVAPILANGWMMAWDASEASDRRIYVPGILQLVGMLIAIAVVGASFVAARSPHARRGGVTTPPG